MLDRIRTHLKEQGYAGNTINAYLDTMTLYIKSKYPIDAGWAELWIIERYSGTSRANIRRHICAINIMLVFLHKSRMRPLSCMDMNVGHKKQKANRMMDKLPLVVAGDTHRDRRNQVIVEILISTGIWIDSLCGLTLNEVSDDYGTISVNSPAGVPTTFMLGGYVRHLLRQYITSIRARLPNAVDSPYVFLSQKGGRLNRKSLWRICGSLDLPDPRTLRMLSTESKKNL